MAPPKRSLAIVVLELDSVWPERVHHADMDVVALGQALGECDAAFVERARKRIARLTRPLDVAVVACNSDVRPAAIQRRSALSRALIEAIDGDPNRVSFVSSEPEKALLHQAQFPQRAPALAEPRGRWMHGSRVTGRKQELSANEEVHSALAMMRT